MADKITLNDITSGLDLVKINDNFQKIETELNNKVLYRDPPKNTVNTMEKDLDMNGQSIYNIPAPYRPTDVARLQDVQNAVANPTAAHLTTFEPYGMISAINVQHAIQQVYELIPGVVDDVYTLEGLTTKVNAIDAEIIDINTQITDIKEDLSHVAIDTNLVHKTGNETVYGTKTFVVSPKVPTPTASDSSTNAANTAWSNSQFVHKTGNETIYGVKTFATPPVGIALPSAWGEIGTYVIAYYAISTPATIGQYANSTGINSYTYAPGSTVNGVDLRVVDSMDALTNYNIYTYDWNEPIPWTFGGASLTGIWRRMGYQSISKAKDSSDTGKYGKWTPCLFVRIG